ncbi:cytochrome P450 [Aspergillus undulatus]|uniref:cytochrome P450 n=1 Tax=Aspergillus undulatus TaxID=1810928 RepID=UPI003CCCA523
MVLWVTDYVRDPLRDVPGPGPARYTRLWYLRKIKGGNFHHENIDLHRKNVPHHQDKIVRIAPNMYSIDDLDAAKIIYGHGTKFTKSDWYSTWTVPAITPVNLFAIQDPKMHAASRRQFASYYSMSTMVSYEAYVDECIRTFHAILEKCSGEKKRMNMGVWLQYYAFDVIGNITFGKSFRFLEGAKDINDMMAKLDQANLYSALAGLFPWIHDLVIRLAESPAQVMNDYIVGVISERKNKLAKGELPPSDNRGTQDFLGKYLATHARDPNVFTPTHILFGSSQNVFAGSDTTAISLSSIVYHLSFNPDCLAKLRDEIDNAASEGRISDLITFAESQSLPYLQAVIKESLRINSAVGLPLWRVVPSGGAMLCGRFFPEGTVVGINPWVAHHNKSIFGADADEFRPERWLDEGRDKDTSTMERYYMPFGLGSRTCIGKNISLLEVGKLIPQLVRYFDFDLERKQDRLVGENHWFVKPKGFEAMPRKLV